MKHTRIAATAVLLLAVAALYASRDRFRATPARFPVPQAAAPSADSVGARIDALAITPQARAYRQRQEFELRIKRFLAKAPALGAVERSEQARTLSSAIDDSARATEMSAGEAFVLQAALIDASAADADERIDRMARLVERHRRNTEQREARWLDSQNRNPQFQDYKARERTIVAEVSAMAEIPGGLTRDTYLRLRLQQAREQSYR